MRALAALPDRRVTSGGDDRTVRLWDVEFRCEIAQLRCSSVPLARESAGVAAVLMLLTPARSLSWAVRVGENPHDRPTRR
jgi:hypothetical protein